MEPVEQTEQTDRADPQGTVIPGETEIPLTMRLDFALLLMQLVGQADPTGLFKGAEMGEMKRQIDAAVAAQVQKARRRPKGEPPGGGPTG